MTSSSIKVHQQVLELLHENLNYLEIFSTYAPAHKFIEAVVNPDNFSFSVNDEDGSIFAMALGSNPVILDGDEIATSRNVILLNNLEVRNLSKIHLSTLSLWQNCFEVLHSFT